MVATGHRRVPSTIATNGGGVDDKIVAHQHAYNNYNNYSQQPPTHYPVHHRQERRVCFDDELNQVHHVKRFSSSLWFSHEEIEQFRATSKEDVERLFKGDLADDPLSQAYKQVMQSLHHKCLGITVNGNFPRLSRADCEAVANAFELVGLERWMKRVRRDKGDRLAEMMHNIQEQQKLRDNHQYHQTDEWIRWHCDQISIPSRLFAYLVALAHAQQQQPQQPH